MGVLPLQFKPGDSHESLGLNGTETYQIAGIERDLFPRKRTAGHCRTPGRQTNPVSVIARLDSPVEVTYYRHGGILNYVLRSMA